MEAAEEGEPAAVPVRARQAGEIRARWAWVEPSVWTDRMLEALETGVKGGKWFSLIDKVYRRENLRAGFRKVAANKGAPGVDHVTIEQFRRDEEAQLERLERTLRDGTYQPQAIRRTYIPKPGSREKRPLGIPTVRDRTVEAALRQVMEPIFEHEFAERSYGFRPERGCKDALREVDECLRKGCRHVVEADWKSYFDTIPWEQLMERVEEQIADGRVLALVRAFLSQGVMEEGQLRDAKEGTPQGGVISPLLANIYLNALDQHMARLGHVMIRYADDLVILCPSREQAQAALEELRGWTTEAGLKLHPDKTRCVDMNQPGEGFDFLGYHFAHTRTGKLDRWPRKKSIRKVKDSIRAVTRRANGRSLDQIIQKTNRITRGWFEYFKHSNRWAFPALDAWIRHRLRCILRRRQHRKGRARGPDHQRWPNAYFAEHGLFSLVQARAAALQPT
ncbi:MAG: group II intron reverse transcriptase/maturase [Planctomycetota bacterium]